MPNFEMIRGLNLPGTPRATSACRGTPLLYFIGTDGEATDSIRPKYDTDTRPSVTPSTTNPIYTVL